MSVIFVNAEVVCTKNILIALQSVTIKSLVSWNQKLKSLARWRQDLIDITTFNHIALVLFIAFVCFVYVLNNLLLYDLVITFIPAGDLFSV